jgi:DNA-binding transcriptional LysR family regulator
MGIALLPAICCADDVRAGRLSRVLPEFTSETAPIYAVYPSAQLLTPKVRAFIDFMSERLVTES